MESKEKERKDFLEKLKGMTFDEVVAYDGPSPLDDIDMKENVYLNCGKPNNTTFIKSLDIALRSEGETPELMEYLKAIAYIDKPSYELKVGDSILGEHGTTVNNYLIDIKDFSEKKLN